MTADAALEPQLSAWITATIGAPVSALEQIVGGFSRRTYAVTAADGRRLIARVDLPDAPLAGTELTLTREAQAYRALAGTALPTPELLAARDDGSALLFERSPGIPQLDALSPADEQRVILDYIDQLATLHGLDPTALGFPGPSRRPAVLEDLDRWERILAVRTTGAWPVARLAFRMLRAHVPDDDAPAVLCHGDAGPKNFLHDGAKVTALLDWEFWHFGDPHDDLAWWAWRAHERGLGGGDLRAELARWQAQAGRPLSAAALEYYSVVIRTRVLVIVAAALEQRVHGVDQSVFLALDAVLSYQILRGLSRLEGGGDDRPDAPRAHPAAQLGESALAFYRQEYVATDALEPRASAVARAADNYLRHLDAVARYGPAILDGEVEDAAKLLGWDPATDGPVEAYVEAAVTAGDRDGDVLPYLLRSRFRRAWLWPATVAQVTGPPIDFASVLAQPSPQE